MRAVFLSAVVILSLVFWHQVSVGIEVKGGIMEDAVVADSGSTDSTFVTKLKEGWKPIGPRSFDVDKDRNIYIFDSLGAKVMHYDKDGRFVSSFLVSNMRGNRNRVRSTRISQWITGGIVTSSREIPLLNSRQLGLHFMAYLPGWRSTVLSEGRSMLL